MALQYNLRLDVVILPGVLLLLRMALVMAFLVLSNLPLIFLSFFFFWVVEKCINIIDSDSIK